MIHDTPAIEDEEISKNGNLDGQFRGDDLARLFALLRDRDTNNPPADLPLGGSYHLPPQGPITSAPVHADAVGDEMEALREDLVVKAATLIAALEGSNQHAAVSTAATHYRDRMGKPVPEIPLNLLFSAANSLRAALTAHETADAQGYLNDMLPPAAAAALSDLLTTHGPFWLSLPEAAEIEARARNYLDGERQPELLDTARPVVTALEGKDSVLTPADQEALTDDLMAAEGEGAPAELAEKTLKARLWNLLGAVGRKVLMGGAAAAGATVVSVEVSQWLLAHESAIWGFLQYAQGKNAAWFPEVIKVIRSLL